jgi:hypothetical protein
MQQNSLGLMGYALFKYDKNISEIYRRRKSIGHPYVLKRPYGISLI